jgi:Beta-ketoacyl synthase, N-terminal domain
VSSFAVWTGDGVSVNTSPPTGPAEGALAPWPGAPALAAIHPKGRRPHRQAVVLVQLAHALLAARAAAGQGAPPPQEAAHTDLLLGTAAGSAAADLDFLDGLQERGSGFGSPSTFVYTLATAAPAEVALALGLRGSLATLSAGSISGLCAVVRATTHVSQGRSRACITGGFELGGLRTRAVEGEGDVAVLFLLEASEHPTRWTKVSNAELGFDPDAAAVVGALDSPLNSLLALASACADLERPTPIEIAGRSREGYWARIRSTGIS